MSAQSIHYSGWNRFADHQGGVSEITRLGVGVIVWHRPLRGFLEYRNGAPGPVIDRPDLVAERNAALDEHKKSGLS